MEQKTITIEHTEKGDLRVSGLGFTIANPDKNVFYFFIIDTEENLFKALDVDGSIIYPMEEFSTQLMFHTLESIGKDGLDHGERYVAPFPEYHLVTGCVKLTNTTKIAGVE